MMVPHCDICRKETSPRERVWANGLATTDPLRDVTMTVEFQTSKRSKVDLCNDCFKKVHCGSEVQW